jgi:hypothetical protein
MSGRDLSEVVEVFFFLDLLLERSMAKARQPLNLEVAV